MESIASRPSDNLVIKRYSEYSRLNNEVNPINDSWFLFLGAFRNNKDLLPLMYPELREPGERPIIVIGGLYPENDSFDFLIKQAKVYDWQLMIIDHNPDTLKKLKERVNEMGDELTGILDIEDVIHHDLTQIDQVDVFKKGRRIDALFMDYTTDFMAKEDLVKLSGSSRMVLKDTGAVVCTQTIIEKIPIFNIFKWAAQLRMRNQYKVDDVSSRDVVEFRKAMRNLVCVDHLMGKKEELFVFQKDGVEAPMHNPRVIERSPNLPSSSKNSRSPY